MKFGTHDGRSRYLSYLPAACRAFCDLPLSDHFIQPLFCTVLAKEVVTRRDHTHEPRVFEIYQTDWTLHNFFLFVLLTALAAINHSHFFFRTSNNKLYLCSTLMTIEIEFTIHCNGLICRGKKYAYLHHYTLNVHTSNRIK